MYLYVVYVRGGCGVRGVCGVCTWCMFVTCSVYFVLYMYVLMLVCTYIRSMCVEWYVEYVEWYVRVRRMLFCPVFTQFLRSFYGGMWRRREFRIPDPPYPPPQRFF